MSGTVPQQLPYLVLTLAIHHPDVQDVAYISAASVAMAVALAGGAALPSEPAGTTYTAQQVANRVELAKKVIGRKIDQTILATALVLVPEVAAALAGGDMSNPPALLMEVDLAAVWVRNWTNYATLIAALG